MVAIGSNEHSALVLLRMFELLSCDDKSRSKSSDELHWSYPFSEYQATLMSLSTSIHKDGRLVRGSLMFTKF